MALEKVREYLKGFGADGRIMELDESSATVALAAHALGCEEKRIAKSLSFLVDGKPIVIVCAGDARVDNKSFRSYFGCKAKMLDRQETEPLIGHAPGGVCPFALNDGVKVYLDESLKRFETVFPACGSPNSAIELSILELERFSKFESWVEVTKVE